MGKEGGVGVGVSVWGEIKSNLSNDRLPLGGCWNRAGGRKVCRCKKRKWRFCDTRRGVMTEEGKKEKGLLVMTMTMGDNGGLVVEAVVRQWFRCGRVGGNFVSQAKPRGAAKKKRERKKREFKGERIAGLQMRELNYNTTYIL